MKISNVIITLLLIILIIILTISIYTFITRFQYINIPSDAVDCGYESLQGVTNINLSARECFITSYQECRPAVIKKDIYGIDSRIQETAIVETFENNKCQIRFYFKDSYSIGGVTLRENVCNNVTISSNIRNQDNYLTLTGCDSNTDIIF
jgi:hypothetical protein